MWIRQKLQRKLKLVTKIEGCRKSLEYVVPQIPVLLTKILKIKLNKTQQNIFWEIGEWHNKKEAYKGT